MDRTGAGRRSGAIAGAMIAWAVGTAALAQDRAWVQIEAVQSEADGIARAGAYAQRLPDVNGFALGAGWFGIALGPYATADAQGVLSQLRSSSAIPADSFIVDGRQFGAMFWPVGGTVAREPASPAGGRRRLP